MHKKIIMYIFNHLISTLPTYAAYGGIFIIMAIAWGWIFERIAPDIFDIVGAVIAVVGVIVIFYMPRKDGERSIWSKQQ
jgi:drug/metabolite transporter superfamily protein YnfA